MLTQTLAYQPALLLGDGMHQNKAEVSEVTGQ